MRSVEYGENLAGRSQMRDLRVGAREMAMQVNSSAGPFEQEGYVAGDQPVAAVGYQDAEIVPLDVLDQHIQTRFGEGGGEINHLTVP
jgi:hypothetical protein